MQAVITDDEKSSTLIDVNEMYNIIKKAIENEEEIFYVGSFISEEDLDRIYVGSFISKEDFDRSIQKIKLNENNISFQFFTLEDDEVIKKIEEIIASSKESKKSSSYKAWYISDQEKNDKFFDLWLLIGKKIKSYVYFQILIEDNLYIIYYSTFEKLYKMMNEKSINYIFSEKTYQIKSCNPPLNFNSESALDSSFLLPFQILVETKENNKYILTGYVHITCSNNEVIKITGCCIVIIQKI